MKVEKDMIGNGHVHGPSVANDLYHLIMDVKVIMAMQNHLE